jgi:hypothetical protein
VPNEVFLFGKNWFQKAGYVTMQTTRKAIGLHPGFNNPVNESGSIKKQ